MANVSDIVKVGTGKETGICSLREPYLFHSFKKQRDEFCHATTPPFERISLSPVLLYMYYVNMFRSGDRVHSAGGVRVLAVRDGGQAGGDDGQEAGQPGRGVPAARHRPEASGVNGC